MRFSHLSIGLLALLTPLSAAWSKEDREIFRIRDEIAAHERDPASTFYDILGISNSATLDEINKAYRKLSRSLHPDKVSQQLKAGRAKAAKKDSKTAPAPPVKPPTQKEIKAAVKDASERQARLSLIANILRGPGRDRYDHYLSNGFPLWKGTDYYYNRYRPGLGTVTAGAFLLIGGAVHYLILYMSWRRQKEFVQRYVNFARDTAWGDNFEIPNVTAEPAPPAQEEGGEDAVPVPQNRKERRMMEKEKKKDQGRGRAKKAAKKQKSASVSREVSAGPVGAKKRVVAENGKVLVVDSQGDVYLEERDEEGTVKEFLLDPNELTQPSFTDTAVVRVPLWAFNSTVGRFLPGKPGDSGAFEGEEEDSDRPQLTPTTDSEEFELLEKSTDSMGKAKSSGAAQGGRANRRKGRKA